MTASRSFSAKANQRALQVSDFKVCSADFRDEPKSYIGCDLVVPAPACVQFFPCRANLANQRRLDVHVNIFAIAVPLEFAGLDLALNGTQPAFDLQRLRPV